MTDLTSTPGAIDVVAVSGGVGFPSSTRRLTDALLDSVQRAAAEQHIAVAARTVEVRDLAVDVANATVAGLPSPELDQALLAIERADLVITASPVFRGSYAGIFKSLWDLVDPVAMRGKPVLLGATGGSHRHQLMIDATMRPLFAYFGSLIVPTAVYAATEDVDLGPKRAPELARRIEQAGADAVRVLPAARTTQLH